jgi:hypothetical protein
MVVKVVLEELNHGKVVNVEVHGKVENVVRAKVRNVNVARCETAAV